MPTSTEETVVTEVDINDVPINCRDLLTKGKTQEEVQRRCVGVGGQTMFPLKQFVLSVSLDTTAKCCIIHLLSDPVNNEH